MTNDPTFSEKITLQKEAEILATQSHNNEQKIPQKRRPKAGKKEDQPQTIKNCKVLVQGDKNVLYNLAQCCHPNYPDLIVGYVTRSKGVTIHKADCLIYHRIPNKGARVVEVQWDKGDD